MRTKTTALLLATLAIFGATVAIAAAEEVSTEAYVAQVEPICKKNTTEIEKDLKPVKSDIRKGNLKAAGAAVAKAAKSLQSAYSQLSDVTRPTASEATLTKWLGYLKTEVSLTNATSKALKAGKKSLASHDESLLLHNSNLANAAVFSFHFHYCRSELSKFI
ncbi:MAG: hypothetical protein WB507_01895 [Solirubrobacterales bacterium]